MSSLLVVLVLDMHEKSLDVLRFRVTTVFVQSKVVVSQLAFILSYIFD